MADSQFFSRSGPFDLESICAAVGGTVADDADKGRQFRDVAPLDLAGPDEISFLDNKKYIQAFEASRAGACFVEQDLAERAPEGMIAILCEQPYLALALTTRMYYPPEPVEPGISAAAHVDPAASLGNGCRIDAGAVIEAGVSIGDRCHIAAGAVICRHVTLGDDCHLGVNATLMFCHVGSRVWIDTGVRVGTQGFGFAPGPTGAVRIPHTGRVIIGDDVEVGANTTIDRGTAGDTVIGPGCMIDNQVQIAHNVTMGRGVVLAGQVGLAGSSRVDDFAMLGGKSGTANHVKVGVGAKLGALSGAATDLKPGVTYLGQPAIPIKDFWRREAAIRRLLKQGRGA